MTKEIPVFKGRDMTVERIAEKKKELLATLAALELRAATIVTPEYIQAKAERAAARSMLTTSKDERIITLLAGLTPEKRAWVLAQAGSKPTMPVQATMPIVADKAPLGAVLAGGLVPTPGMSRKARKKLRRLQESERMVLT
jgi:hypothetical protein